MLFFKVWKQNRKLIMNKIISCNIKNISCAQFYEKFPGSAAAGAAGHFPTLVSALTY